MESKSKVMFVVLVLCGTLCVLAAMGAMIYLYHLHSVEIALHHEGTGMPHYFSFTLFVGLPSALGFLVGIVLVAMGIKIGRSG